MNYLYYDNQTGEYFYVVANSIDSADRIAYFYFDDTAFLSLAAASLPPDLWHYFCQDYTAEMMGYDTY